MAGAERRVTLGTVARAAGVSVPTVSLRLAGGERIDAPHMELTTELVVRESTAEPR
jgi:DNA-binding LacI/PurR family transcriptional regulator